MASEVACENGAPDESQRSAKICEENGTSLNARKCSRERPFWPLRSRQMCVGYCVGTGIEDLGARTSQRRASGVSQGDQEIRRGARGSSTDEN